MRARPNLMTQTLDGVGGLVASRLHDRTQAYAGVCATLRDMGGLVASRLHDRMQACAGVCVCARVRYRREPMKRQKAQKAMTQTVISTMILMGYPGGMVLMSF